MKKNIKKKGFTLVELIVVIAILGILAAVAVPRLSGFRTNAQNAANASNISIVENALQAYLLDNGHTGDYVNATLAADGTVGGTGVTAGNLVPNYLKAMPTQPDGSGSYVKAAGANEEVEAQ